MMAVIRRPAANRWVMGAFMRTSVGAMRCLLWPEWGFMNGFIPSMNMRS